MINLVVVLSNTVSVSKNATSATAFHSKIIINNVVTEYVKYFDYSVGFDTININV